MPWSEGPLGVTHTNPVRVLGLMAIRAGLTGRFRLSVVSTELPVVSDTWMLLPLGPVLVKGWPTRNSLFSGSYSTSVPLCAWLVAPRRVTGKPIFVFRL